MDTGASRLRVTPHEFFHEVRPHLKTQGLTEHQINQVEATFHSSLMGNPDHPAYTAGIDQKVLDQTLGYMKAHPSASALGEHAWGKVAEVMQRQINERK